jgi:hypothetical protein
MGEIKCSTSTEWLQVLDGWEAARSGQTYDRNQTSLWKAGFALRISQQPSWPTFNPELAAMPPSTATRSTGSDSSASPLKRLLQSRRVRTA